MTPLQAEMLTNTLAMIASIVAIDCLELSEDDPLIYQEAVAKECRKAFRSQLTSHKLVTQDPPKKQRKAAAQEPKPGAWVTWGSARSVRPIGRTENNT